MSMPDPQFTNAGRLLQLAALDGAPLKFTRIALGDGRLSSEAPAKLTQLIHEVVSIGITRSSRAKDYLSLGGPFNPAELREGFWWRELGIYAEGTGGAEVLYCYSNAFEEGEYLQPDAQKLERTLTVGVIVGDAQNVSAVINESLAFATQSDLSEIKFQMAHKAGQILIGPATLINELEPGGLLFITDEGSALVEAVTLEKLLVQGYLAAKGRANTLEDMVTPGVARALNLRRDSAGTCFNEENYSELAALLLELCTASVSSNLYVNEEAGRIEATWQQTQYFIIYGRLVDSALAAAQVWPWYSTPASDYAALRQEVAALRATIGDIDTVLDEVNGGGA